MRFSTSISLLAAIVVGSTTVLANNYDESNSQYARDIDIELGARDGTLMNSVRELQSELQGRGLDYDEIDISVREFLDAMNERDIDGSTIEARARTSGSGRTKQGASRGNGNRQLVADTVVAAAAAAAQVAIVAHAQPPAQIPLPREYLDELVARAGGGGRDGGGGGGGGARGGSGGGGRGGARASARSGARALARAGGRAMTKGSAPRGNARGGSKGKEKGPKIKMDLRRFNKHIVKDIIDVTTGHTAAGQPEARAYDTGLVLSARDFLELNEGLKARFLD